ncbi:two-pore potassium channel 5 [Typha latifolia]|uniref:two-pore potassium channel 5 n=1 Tax=Typha latifolia TaxID=4733 RepID=UPI003C2B6F0D
MGGGEVEQEPLLPPKRLLHSHLSNPLPLSSEISYATSTSTSAHGSAPHRKSSGLHRTRTAPAMAVLRDLLPIPGPDLSNINPPNLASSGSVLNTAALLLLLYLTLGVAVYSAASPDGFSGVETHPAVDALYFSIVTLCTIGYGDIAPLTPATKVFSCLFVLVGFGLIDVLLSAAVSYVLDIQEAAILAGFRTGYLVDAQKGRMRIRSKVALAVAAVVLCVGVGTIALYLLEDLNWIDAVYLSVMSVTTVGYGDRAFNTLPGRIFASLWLLVSTLAVARAFLFLAEARIDKRHRRIVKWVLHRDLTIEDLFAADINQNGFISKSEFVIYKLKEMGKINEKDILQICDQFNRLDTNNTGKITLPDLLNATR